MKALPLDRHRAFVLRHGLCGPPRASRRNIVSGSIPQTRSPRPPSNSQSPVRKPIQTDGVGETTRRRGEPSARNAELDGVLTIPKIWLLLAFDVKLPVAQRGPRQLGIQRVLLCLSTASSITASRYVSRGIRGRLRQAYSTAESGRSSGNGPNASPIFSACPPPPTLSSSS